MRYFAGFAVAGISGVVLWKLFATILVPLLGMALGLIAMAVKLALVAGVVCFVYSMIRKRRRAAEV